MRCPSFLSASSLLSDTHTWEQRKCELYDNNIDHGERTKQSESYSSFKSARESESATLVAEQTDTPADSDSLY